MSDSNEPSYYEIALTNRQVLVAFVILLLAVLLAFLGGVWLGRKGASPVTAEKGRAQQQSATTAQQEGQSALKQFNFFSDEEKAGKASAPSQAAPDKPAPKSPSTLEAQIGVPPPNGGATGNSGKAVTAPPKTSATPPSETQRPSTPATSQPAPATAQTVKQPVPSTFPDTTTGDLVVQVFSSVSLQQAQEIASRLKKAGYRAFLSPVKVGDQVMHRVRIGPFEQHDEAARVAEKIRKSFKLETWITH